MGATVSVVDSIQEKISTADENVIVTKEEANQLLEKIRQLESKCEQLGHGNSSKLSVFCSYSWKNSKLAVDAKQADKSIGITDPREIILRLQSELGISVKADFLESSGTISAEEYKRMLPGCKAMVAFLSNEFVAESSLVSQFQQAKENGIPIIAVVVGGDWASGWDWQKSPVGLMIAGELYIDMTSPNTVADKFSELSQRVSNLLSGTAQLISGSKDEMDPKAKPIDCPVFLSYCWINSKDAAEKKEVSSAIGVTDPRLIHSQLTSNGIMVWLDKVQLGKKGLFEDIAQGLLGAMVVVACISTDYSKSENCCLEFMYSKKTLRLPIIPLIVGNDHEWRKSKVGLLLSDSDPIDCTDGFTEEKQIELNERIRSLLHGDHKYTPNMNDLKVGDCLELYYPNEGRGDLDYSEEFNHDPAAIVGLQDGRKYLCSAYWWPVRVIEVYSKDSVKIEWLSYEGEWDQDASPKDMRPTQYTNSDSIDHLKVGDSVQVKLAQYKSYAWVDGTVIDFCNDGRVEVQIKDPMTMKEASEHEGAHIEFVRVKKACIFVSK